MNLYRLSLEARPGPREVQADFGDVAENLGPFGVEVLGITIHGSRQADSADSADSADEVVVDLTRPIDLPLIEYALKPTGRRLLALNALPPA